MNAQIDMFPTAWISPVKLRRELMWLHARAPHIEAEVLAIVRAQPDEWLDYSSFSSLMQGHEIGSIFGHVLHEICRKGLVDERTIYFDGIAPGHKGYSGSRSQYRAAPRVEVATC
jgi:hypothetical protein